MSAASSDELRAAYDEDGFVVVRDAVDPAVIAEVRHIVEALVASRAGWERGDCLDLLGTDEPGARWTTQLLMPQRYAPALRTSPLRDAAWSIARALLGPDVVSEGEHVIYKPARDGGATPLHQDEAFWSASTEYRSLSIWFPLVDVDESSGCMQFVEASHRGPILDHRPVDGDPLNNSIEIVGAPPGAPIPVPLAVGGATVHHSRTVHGACPNRSAHDRPAYIFGFGLPARRRGDVDTHPWNVGRTLRRETRARANGFEPTRMRPEL